MKKLILVAVVWLAPGIAVLGDDKEDIKKIQGTWMAVSAETEGRQLPEEKIKDFFYLFDGQKMVVQIGEDSFEERFSLDSSRKPKALTIFKKDTVFDAATRKKTEEERSVPGIYELDGDKLTLCFDDRGGGRPAEFRTKPGSHLVLIVFRREKP